MKVSFDQEQLNLLRDLGFNASPDNEFSEQDLLGIDERVTEYLQMKGIQNDRLNDTGRLCESILDLISEL